jgi:hypothetical protein
LGFRAIGAVRSSARSNAARAAAACSLGGTLNAASSGWWCASLF